AKPLYKSSIEVQIEKENPNQLTVDDLFGIAASDQEFLQTQYILLKSRGLAEKVIDDQKLLSDPEFYPQGIAGKTPAQIAQIRSDIESTRRQLQQFGESKGIISTADANSIPQQRLAKSNADLQNAINVRLDKQNAYNSLLLANPESVTSNDLLVSQLTQEESKQQRDYNQNLSTYLPGHPTMLALKNAIAKTHQARMAAVSAAFERAKEAAHRDLIAAQQSENQMSAAVDAQKRETMNLNVSAAGFTDLTNTLQSKQNLLDQLEKRQNETEITARLKGSMSSSNIHFVDHAELPSARFNITMRKNLQSAFPLGVVLGLAAIFFLEYMDRSIKTPEELERVTKFASLGVIPSASSAGRGNYGYG